jgi:hypothetical protein
MTAPVMAAERVEQGKAHAHASSSGVGWRLHGKTRCFGGGYTRQYRRVTRSVKPAEYQFFGVGTGSRANRSTVTA